MTTSKATSTSSSTGWLAKLLFWWWNFGWASYNGFFSLVLKSDRIGLGYTGISILYALAMIGAACNNWIMTRLVSQKSSLFSLNAGFVVSLSLVLCFVTEAWVIIVIAGVLLASAPYWNLFTDVLVFQRLGVRASFTQQRLFGTLAYGIGSTVLGRILDAWTTRQATALSVWFLGSAVFLLIVVARVMWQTRAEPSQSLKSVVAPLPQVHKSPFNFRNWLAELHQNQRVHAHFYVSLCVVGIANYVMKVFAYPVYSSRLNASALQLGLSGLCSAVLECIVFGSGAWLNSALTWRGMLASVHLVVGLRMLGIVLIDESTAAWLYPLESLQGLAFGLIWSMVPSYTRECFTAGDEVAFRITHLVYYQLGPLIGLICTFGLSVTNNSLDPLFAACAALNGLALFAAGVFHPSLATAGSGIPSRSTWTLETESASLRWASAAEREAFWSLHGRRVTRVRVYACSKIASMCRWATLSLLEDVHSGQKLVRKSGKIMQELSSMLLLRERPEIIAHAFHTVPFYYTSRQPATMFMKFMPATSPPSQEQRSLPPGTIEIAATVVPIDDTAAANLVDNKSKEMLSSAISLVSPLERDCLDAHYLLFRPLLSMNLGAVHAPGTVENLFLPWSMRLDDKHVFQLGLLRTAASKKTTASPVMESQIFQSFRNSWSSFERFCECVYARCPAVLCHGDLKRENLITVDHPPLHYSANMLSQPFDSSPSSNTASLHAHNYLIDLDHLGWWHFGSDQGATWAMESFYGRWSIEVALELLNQVEADMQRETEKRYGYNAVRSEKEGSVDNDSVAHPTWSHSTIRSVIHSFHIRSYLVLLEMCLLECEDEHMAEYLQQNPTIADQRRRVTTVLGLELLNRLEADQAEAEQLSRETSSQSDPIITRRRRYSSSSHDSESSSVRFHASSD